MYLYVCLHVAMYTCMHVCIPTCTYVCIMHNQYTHRESKQKERKGATMYMDMYIDEQGPLLVPPSVNLDNLLAYKDFKFISSSSTSRF